MSKAIAALYSGSVASADRDEFCLQLTLLILVFHVANLLRRADDLHRNVSEFIVLLQWLEGRCCKRRWGNGYAVL